VALALRGARARLRSSAPDKSGNDQRQEGSHPPGGTHVLRVVRVQVSLNNIS